MKLQKRFRQALPKLFNYKFTWVSCHMLLRDHCNLVTNFKIWLEGNQNISKLTKRVHHSWTVAIRIPNVSNDSNTKNHLLYKNLTFWQQVLLPSSEKVQYN